MAILGDVSDALASVADAIQRIQTISAAIESGRDYLTTKHPAVAKHLAKLCHEMSKSALALAAASSIVTNFSFTVGNARAESALDFNRELVAQKAKAEAVRQTIGVMRGHCSVIKEHVEAIRRRADPSGLRSLAGVLGLHSEERERQIADALEGIYDEEMEYHRGVVEMAKAIRMALDDVRNTLGPPATFDPENVPDAAVRLGEYARAFSGLESRCLAVALDLQASIAALQVRV